MPLSSHAPVVVSLTTDFGLADPFVGLVKAEILQRCPQARLVDLTHGIDPQRIEQAAFWLERSWRHFPVGALHLVVVDPGVGSARDLLCARVAGQTFLGPDNGVLGGIAASPGAGVRVVAPRTLERLGLARPSATFHGRDLFAPLAGELAAGRLAFEDLGPVAPGWVPRPGPNPLVDPDGITGRVILVDRFGNCFSNIDAEVIVTHQITEVSFGGHAMPLVRTYADRPPGTDVALLNAFGVLEAARVGGNASQALGLGPGSAVRVGWPRGGPTTRPAGGGRA